MFLVEKIRMFGTTQMLMLITGMTLVIWGVAMMLVNRFVDKRSAEMKQIALQLAFSFREMGDGSILSEFSGIPLFRFEQIEFEKNLLTRGMEQAFIAIFDYTTLLGQTAPSEDAVPTSRTVICFKTSNMMLPPFSVRQKSPLSEQYAAGLEEHLGYQRIEWADFPRFDAMYQMYGKDTDKETIKNLFLNSGLTILCEKEKDLCIEANGNALVVHRHLKTIPPQEMEQFLETAVQVHDLLEHSCQYYLPG